jgi:hypothetical protein
MAKLLESRGVLDKYEGALPTSSALSSFGGRRSPSTDGPRKGDMR